jgi:uridine phosphorylase
MKPITPSELILNSDGSVFHLHLKPEELADNVILVGDPGRVEMISSFFETKETVKSSREFNTVTGKYKGKRITVLSTGIGTDNIDIVMNELDALVNIDLKTRVVKDEHKSLNILRIGTSGAIQPDIPLGSFVLSHISIGCDGLLNWYSGRDAVCDLDMEREFVEFTRLINTLPAPYFIHSSDKMINILKDVTIEGVTISASGFYGPQGRVLRIPLAMPDMLEKFENFRYNGRRITNFEMESSAIAGLSAILGHNATTVCCIIANRHRKESKADYSSDIKRLVELSLNRIIQL